MQLHQSWEAITFWRVPNEHHALLQQLMFHEVQLVSPQRCTGGRGRSMLAQLVPTVNTNTTPSLAWIRCLCCYTIPSIFPSSRHSSDDSINQDGLFFTGSTWLVSLQRYLLTQAWRLGGALAHSNFWDTIYDFENVVDIKLNKPVKSHSPPLKLSLSHHYLWISNLK